MAFSLVPELLGRQLPKLARSTYSFTLGWLREWTELWLDPEPNSSKATFVLRHFLLKLIGLIFCDSFGYYVSSAWLTYIIDVNRLDHYDWGGTSYARLL